MKKEYRLTRNEDFGKVISKKKSFANRSFIVYFNENSEGHARIGISVSKKLGKAVMRNKIKRQVRMMVQEIFDFHHPLDCVIIVRNTYLFLNFEENKKELEYMYKKIIKRMGK